MLRFHFFFLSYALLFLSTSKRTEQVNKSRGISSFYWSQKQAKHTNKMEKCVAEIVKKLSILSFYTPDHYDNITDPVWIEIQNGRFVSFTWFQHTFPLNSEDSELADIHFAMLDGRLVVNLHFSEVSFPNYIIFPTTRDLMDCKTIEECVQRQWGLSYRVEDMKCRIDEPQIVLTRPPSWRFSMLKAGDVFYFMRVEGDAFSCFARKGIRCETCGTIPPVILNYFAVKCSKTGAYRLRRKFCVGLHVTDDDESTMIYLEPGTTLPRMIDGHRFRLWVYPPSSDPPWPPAVSNFHRMATFCELFSEQPDANGQKPNEDFFWKTVQEVSKKRDQTSSSSSSE
jgi:hypothetical protein